MSRTILVVEDEPDIRALLQISLERVGGMTVHAVTSGAQAAAAVEEHRPDAVVMDVQMPQMTGPEALVEVRAGAHGATVPVVFLTASAHEARLVELRALDVHGVLLKPFDPLGLADELRALLGWD